MLDLCWSDPNYFGWWARECMAVARSSWLDWSWNHCLFYSHLFLCGHWLWSLNQKYCCESSICGGAHHIVSLDSGVWTTRPIMKVPIDCTIAVRQDPIIRQALLLYHVCMHLSNIFSCTVIKNVGLVDNRLIMVHAHTKKWKKKKKEACQVVNNPVGCYYPANRQLKRG